MSNNVNNSVNASKEILLLPEKSMKSRVKFNYNNRENLTNN